MRPRQQNDSFHAIAHPARRAILVLLKSGEQPARALARPFGMSFPAVSQHLKILREADLVGERREGRQRLYQLKPAALYEVAGWVAEFAAFFNARLDALEAHLDRKYPGTPE